MIDDVVTQFTRGFYITLSFSPEIINLTSRSGFLSSPLLPQIAVPRKSEQQQRDITKTPVRKAGILAALRKIRRKETLLEFWL